MMHLYARSDSAQVAGMHRAFPTLYCRRSIVNPRIVQLKYKKQ